MVKGVLRWLLRSWRCRVAGIHNIPRRGRVIIAPNHTSYLDPPFVGAVLPRPIFYMAKAELFEIPVLGWLIRHLGSFPVRRGVADRAALRRAEQLLRAGEGLMVFPEGRRSVDGRLQPAELGIAMLALRTGAPVVPIGVDGTDRALPRHSFLIRPARIRIRIGPPLIFDDLRSTGPLRREVLYDAARRITAALAELVPPWRAARVKASRTHALPP